MRRERDDEIEEVLESFLVELPSTGDDDRPLLKAVPKTEGNRRYLYCEPSNESWDSENERVLRKALAASKDYFLKFGNFDINHYTLFGLRMDPPLRSPHLYEIGKPVEVVCEPRIFVKGVIYSGPARSAEQANIFWGSLTDQDPAQTWYPSVGGHRPQKVQHPSGRKTVVGVRWTNIGFAKEPQNTTVVPATIIAPDVFLKAVTAGYSTDSNGMTGGGALRRQSLEGAHRAAGGRFFSALRSKSCAHAEGSQSLAKMVDHFRQCEGMDEDAARHTAESVLTDVAKRIRSRQHDSAAARIAA